MLKNYLKLALKVLLRRKFFTFVSLFGVAFTLLVLLVAAAVLDHLFVPQGVEKKLDRTLFVRRLRLIGERGVMSTPPGYRFLDQHVRKMTTPERISIFSTRRKVASYQGGRKFDLVLKRTDGEYWKILDFDFIEGGPITAADEQKANFVAVVNESTKKKFFGDRPAIGKWISVDGQRFRVTGVVRDVSDLRFSAFADVWVPISTAKSDSYRDGLSGDFIGMLQAKTRDDLPKMKEEFTALVPTVEVPKDWDRLEVFADSLFDDLARGVFGTSRTVLLRVILVAAALLFMTLPAVNLVNLNLSRILERASEIGVRKAFGASTHKLVGQFVIENIVLTVIGGIAGLLLAAIVLAAVNNIDLIPYSDLRVNFRVFAYAMVMAVVFGLLSGVYPAWRMSRLHPVQALRGGTR